MKKQSIRLENSYQVWCQITLLRSVLMCIRNDINNMERDVIQSPGNTL